jgi:hypothetical protein
MIQIVNEFTHISAGNNIVDIDIQGTPKSSKKSIKAKIYANTDNELSGEKSNNLTNKANDESINNMLIDSKKACSFFVTSLLKVYSTSFFLSFHLIYCLYFVI